MYGDTIPHNSNILELSGLHSSGVTETVRVFPSVLVIITFFS